MVGRSRREEQVKRGGTCSKRRIGPKIKTADSTSCERVSGTRKALRVPVLVCIIASVRWTTILIYLSIRAIFCDTARDEHCDERLQNRFLTEKLMVAGIAAESMEGISSEPGVSG